MRAQQLHVFTAYSNPIRWQNRRAVHAEFEDRILESGAQLVTIECAYGDRPWELLPRAGVTRIPVRASARLLAWNKENLINLGVRRVPDAQNIAWIDGDILFRRKEWAAEAVEALQHYHVVQPWDTAYDLGPRGEHLQTEYSFASRYASGEPLSPIGPRFWRKDGGPYAYPHPGYAWAMTRQAFDWLGGLIETAVAGAADHHMALALIGHAAESIHGYASSAYAAPILAWEHRAMHHIAANIGYVPGTIEHLWHGRKSDRRYVDRWKILTDNAFDPATDLKWNGWGVVELAGNKPRLTRDLDRYFRQRDEDRNSID
jgi:hypothetical protein